MIFFPAEPVISFWVDDKGHQHIVSRIPMDEAIGLISVFAEARKINDSSIQQGSD